MDWITVGLVTASAIRLATPLLLAAMGELISEKAGVLNLSVEGMMLVGAFFAAWASFATGLPWLGLGAGVAASVVLAVIQGVLSVWLRADQVVVGLGLNLVALASTTLLSRLVFGARSQTTVPGFDSLSFAGLSQLPVVGAALFQHNALVYLGLLSVPLTWFVLRQTRFGLAVTAAGAQPQAADKTGIDIPRTRFLAVLYTGALCGMGGAFFSLGDIKTFVEGMTNGAGFIALVAVIFGNWKVLPVAGACVFFGATIALRFLLPAMGIEIPLALLASLPYVAALLAVMGVVGRQRPPAALSIPFMTPR